MSKRTVAALGGVVAIVVVLGTFALKFPFWNSAEKPQNPPSTLQSPLLLTSPQAQNTPRAEARTPAPPGQPEPGEAREVPGSFAPLVKRVMPTVVNVAVTQKVKGFGFGPGMGGGGGQGGGGGEDEPEQPGSPAPNVPNPFGGGGMDPFEQFRRFFGEPREFKQHGLGSGVIVSPDGYILTNNHVVGDAEEIHVTLMDKREFTAKVVGKDAKTDLALIKIDTNEPLPVAPMGDSDKAEVGDWVVAIGNPFGFSLTVTAGIVSAKHRSFQGNYDDFIQTDATINPGNSGGPLFDAQGNVVGINTAIYSRTGSFMGIGFAIPVDLAKNVMDQLKSKGHVTRGWLGVEIQEVTQDLAKSFGLPKAEGALIANVEKAGPAAKAGIQRGDVIIKFNGQDVRDQHELPAMVAETAINKTVPVELIRDGKHKKLDVTVAELKENEVANAKTEQPGSDWGLQVGEITPEIARQFNLQTDKGVVVRGVRPDTPGADAQLQPGDVILEVNHEKVNSMQDFLSKAKAAKKDKKPALLLVQRGNLSLFTVIKPEG